MARAPRPLHAVAVLLRALTGLAVLAALVAGAPYALLRVGHQPTELSGGLDVLTRPDDGTLFLVVLTCIGWLAWGTFALSALLEVTAVVRRRSAPSIRGLGGMQSLASFLVGGIVLLAPTAASAATTSAHAVTVSATHTTDTTAGPSASSTPGSSTTDTGPQHTVDSPHEELWDVAEHYLGDGKRWKDIAAVNPQIPELASGEAQLHPGMVLNLPADARQTPPDQTPAASTPHTDDTTPPEHKPAPTAAAPDTEEAPAAVTEDQAPASTVTVRPGDSLWSIADAHGDPTDWTTIYTTNKDQIEDPDLIYPGQHLTVPAAPDPDHTDPPQQDTKQPDHHKNHPAPSPTDQQRSTPEQDTPTSTPSSTGTGRASHTDQHDTATHTEEEEGSATSPALALAGAGLLAVGAIGFITTRRKLQQRRRRPGRRIPMPTDRAAATEKTLRTVQNPTGVELLDAALRTLARNLAAEHRALPELEAVILRPDGIHLHLAEPQPACPPFTAQDEPALWLCPATTRALATDAQLAEADAPYPGLASLGWDTTGSLVLVDLETIGILRLTGDPDRCRAVLRALAVELATSALVPHLEITVTGTAAERLEHAVPERVARAPHLAHAVASMTAHDADQRRALTATGADTLRAARLIDAATDGAWTPRILLHEDPATSGEAGEPALADLVDALAERPRTSSAVITTTGAHLLPPGSWNLTVPDDDTLVILPGLGLPITLQGLDDSDYTDVLSILTTAISDTDAPAPEWTLTPPADTDEEPEPRSTPPASPVTGPAEEPIAELADGPTLADILGTSTSTGTETAPGVPGPAALPSYVAQPCPSGPPLTVHAHLDHPATDPTPPEHEAGSPRPSTARTPHSAPIVQLLGPVDVEQTAGRVDTNRRRPCTELAAFLILHPGSDHTAIDEALWPGTRVVKSKRAPLISRLRSWLGDDPDGRPYFPRIADDDHHRYALDSAVTCDWTQFQHHYLAGMHATGEDADLALRQALALVRGRPFAAVSPRRYAWAEPWIQEMTSAIVDAAHELATRRLEDGDPRGALWAVGKGLSAAEESEILHRDAFLAHHASGDVEALRAAAARLERINAELDVDMDDASEALLQRLLPRARS